MKVQKTAPQTKPSGTKTFTEGTNKVIRRKPKEQPDATPTTRDGDSPSTTR